MAEIVLFHHVLGLTDGVRAIADRLAADGHTVHTPDLYDGQVASDLEAGLALKEAIGDDTLSARADGAVAGLGSGIVTAGLSLGVLAAQRLAQTRPGVRGALLYEACVPVSGPWAFGPWPDGVAVQIHGMDGDEFFAGEGDLDAARELVAALGPDRAELFTYPGDAHLFLDRSLPSFDAAAADLAVERSLSFLRRIS